MIGAGSTLDWTIMLHDDTEIGEYAQTHGPSGSFPDEVVTQTDRACEILDRATIGAGARLGEPTWIGSATNVGHGVTTVPGTDTGDDVTMGDFSILNGSVIADGTSAVHSVQTGHGVQLEERSVIGDNVVIEPYARVEADCSIPRGAIITETPG